jgi:hypothetical protein
LKHVNLQLARSNHKVSEKIAITAARLDAAFASSLTRASAGANSPFCWSPAIPHREAE